MLLELKKESYLRLGSGCRLLDLENIKRCLKGLNYLASPSEQRKMSSCHEEQLGMNVTRLLLNLMSVIAP